MKKLKKQQQKYFHAFIEQTFLHVLNIEYFNQICSALDFLVFVPSICILVKKKIF